MSKKIKIRVNGGKIIERVPYAKTLGNFCFILARYKNAIWVLNNGDEYLRGYPDIFRPRYILKRL